MIEDRGRLLTEQFNERSAALDALSPADAFDVMNAEDCHIAPAVAAAKPALLDAVDLVVSALRRGGRLIYVGAGTSGRLGVLDAAECPPTFLTPPESVVGVIAGGDAALRGAVEHAEDNRSAGEGEMQQLNVGDRDVVFGIAAGGTTPFVHGALAEAARRGARTVFLSCVPFEQAGDEADVSIRILTGPEVLAGSTRLKAGLATKMALNTVSTLAMVQLGKVYGNLMVDVNAQACGKLTDRAIRLVQRATGLDRATAQQRLADAQWHVKTAIVMQLLGIDRDAALARLRVADGHVRRALAGTA